jgi:hypothetical protein
VGELVRFIVINGAIIIVLVCSAILYYRWSQKRGKGV